MISAATLRAPHAFLGREGGVSTGPFASLNCGLGSGDSRAAVHENRARALARVPATRLVTLAQVHGAAVHTITPDWPDDHHPQGDALVTAHPGLALGALTADCAPVLLAHPEAGVAAAAHAGWKGLQAGVLQATVAAMVALGARPDRITAAIGPCLAQASYEVTDAFAAALHPRWFTPGRPGHRHYDLEGHAAHTLAEAGLTHIHRARTDTYADETRWFSYRRATHRAEPDFGRQLSLIALPVRAHGG